MTDQALWYLTRLRIKKINYYLLCQCGAEKHDQFFVLPRESSFLCRTNQEELLAVAKDFQLTISEEHPCILDINYAFKQLKFFNKKKALPIYKCSSLLNTWNILEDLFYSTGNKPEEITVKDPALLNKIYKKLFWGCNLPSVTPAGRSYLPIFTPSEIKHLKEYLQFIWKTVEPWLGLTTEVTYDKVSLSKKG